MQMSQRGLRNRIHYVLTLAPRWVPESIRWLVLSGKFSKALKTLQRVATFNGKKEEGKKLTMEVGGERLELEQHRVSASLASVSLA